MTNIIILANFSIELMEHHTLKNVRHCLNNNIYSYLETSGGQSSNLYLNTVPFFNTSVKLDICGNLRMFFPILVPNMQFMHRSIDIIRTVLYLRGVFAKRLTVNHSQYVL